MRESAMRKTAWLGGLLVAASLWAAPAHAQKSADTLRIAWRDAVPNVDFYYNSLRTGLIVAHHVWDTLIYRDPETFQLKPQLATSWKYVDDTTIEFELRPGVKFQDGSPMTADDVVYTVQSVLGDKQVAVPSNYAFIDHAEKVDDLHVRIKLKRVFPAALEYFSMTLPIYPKAYRERVGPDGFSKAPIGTGPYKITKVDGTSEIDLERNDAYFDGPKGKPAIKKIVIKEVADATGELTALLGGQVDWIWNYSPDQMDNISRMPTLQVLRSESMRVAYMNMDSAGRTGDTPLKNVKVRQAIMYAVDRATMAKQFMPGGSRVLDAPCYPTQFGCDQQIAVKYDYDPPRAKVLLTEAGYPNGFDTELVSYLLPQWVGAMQNYLGAVGIRAKISQLQVGAVVQRSTEGKNPLEMGSWGSYSINDASAFLPYFFAGGGNDYTRDPEVEKLVQEGGDTVDPDKRRQAYSAAIKRITENADFMPMFTYVTYYAFSKQLNFKAFRDELPRFYLASWK
jgi:peptide/nickel transport system substrate-binding protein